MAPARGHLLDFEIAGDVLPLGRCTDRQRRRRHEQHLPKLPPLPRAKPTVCPGLARCQLLAAPEGRYRDVTGCILCVPPLRRAVTAVTSSQAEPGVPARSGLGLASADSWVRRQCQRRDPMMGAENKAANKVTEIKGKTRRRPARLTTTPTWRPKAG